MKLLLISNSTMPGQAFLEYPKEKIKEFLGPKSLNIAFVPYAAVVLSFDEFEEKVKERFSEIGHNIYGVHRYDNPAGAIKSADAVVVGGGNTWQLVKLMHQNGLMDAIKEKVRAGTPYIGWSAGANVACPTLRTTNDMPITAPASFNTLGLVPFQINPHYLDANPEGHAGETREQRINEFIAINRETYVVGLREGSMLKLDSNNLELIGAKSLRIFRNGNYPRELNPGDSLKFLINS